MTNRRRFLSYLASSPLLLSEERDPVIKDPKDAINVMEFEPACRQALPPAHYGYLATGVDDDRTLRANVAGFNRILLRPRRLIDISHVDLRTELFGTTWDLPFGLAPIGNQKAFHPEGELPVARAAREKKALQIVSTMANSSVEAITEARGGPVWFQLYVNARWEITERLVKRAEQAGCPVMAITVDTQAGRHTETQDRFKRLDNRPCASCHGTKPEDFYRRKPMFSGFEMKGAPGGSYPNMTWETIRRIKSITSMKVLIKGIETREDAQLCVENGLDGIIVSNHGGRAEESGRGTIECLPEVVDGARNRIPVMIDGGFRRGTDMFKAFALGAKYVFVGRPYAWGLSAFGQPGVERVIDIVQAELALVMKQCGTRSIREIKSASVIVKT
jgi:isopentenyl diphosphate isomerase/L-lactate dehydrogenase-like FMN-dependent dehydrogenase